MNPFFLNSALIFDRFEAAFREHDRIFESLRGRLYDEPRPRHTTAAHNRNSRNPHVDSPITPVVARIESNKYNTPYRRDLYTSGTKQHIGKQNTLAREGIKPTVGDASRSAKPRRPSTRQQISSSVDHTALPQGRFGAWQQVAGDDSNKFCTRGLHTVVAGSARKANLFIYNNHVNKNKANSIPQSYRISAQFKLTTESRNMINVVLGYREVKDFSVINIDLLQRTVGLLHCESVPNNLEQLLLNHQEDVQSFTVDHSIALNRFYSFDIDVVNKKDVVVKLNNKVIFTGDSFQSDDSKGKKEIEGPPGILCLCDSELTFKDWKMKAVNEDPLDTSRSRDASEELPNGDGDAKHSKHANENDIPLKFDSIPIAAKSVSSIRDKLKSLKHDSKLVEIIANDIISFDVGIHFNNIASLDDAKRILNEAVVLPLILPEFFTGLREPWKGVLLFGPPGTGKTMLARAIASMNHCTFFNCSASSLISKWRGESEKLVKCLFDAARVCAPSVIFIDEIDALVSARGGEGEHEASRRMKTEIFSQMDGITSSASSGQRVMVLATTNCPWDLDAAMLRRLEKRIYIPLPSLEARCSHFQMCIDNLSASANQVKGLASSLRLSAEEIQELACLTEGFSGADIVLVCRDAAMFPMRRLLSQSSIEDIQKMRSDGTLDVAEITMEDYKNAIKKTKASVQASTIETYESWNQMYAST